MKESEFQKIVLSWLRSEGYFVWKNYLGPMVIHGGKRVKNPNSGQPDIYGILRHKPGRLFAIELKSENGKLSDGQRKEIMDLERAGVNVIISRDLETIKQEMEKIDVT